MLSLPSILGSAAGKRQFAFRAAEQYNSLPPEFADMSVATFKRALLTLFLAGKKKFGIWRGGAPEAPPCDLGSWTT